MFEMAIKRKDLLDLLFADDQKRCDIHQA